MKNRMRLTKNVIGDLWEKYVPYWPLFVILIALSLGGAWLYLRFKLPVYEATATLMIKDEKKGIEGAKMMESLNLLTGKKIIENEIEVIKSRKLVGQVVKELSLYAPVYKVAKWKDQPAYATSPVRIEVKNPDSLKEVAKVQFIFNQRAGSIKFGGNTARLGEWVSTPWGVLKFSETFQKSRPEDVLYFSLINPKKVVQGLIGSIGASTAGKLSSVLILKYSSEVPQQAEDVLNSLVNAYDRASVSDKNTLATNTLSFLEDRLGAVSGNLDSIEKSFQQYRTRKGAIDISTQGKLFLENVSSNDQKISEVNMRLTMLSQIEGAIFIDGKEGLVPTTLGLEDAVLTNLLNKMYETNLEYEKLRQTTGEANPEVLALAEQVRQIKPKILTHIRSQKRTLEINKANLFATNNAYNGTLQALPQQERELIEISREQNIKNSIYTYLLQKKEEAALSRSSTVSDTRIIDKAEASLYPVGTGAKLVYGVAAIMAMALGFGIITVKDLLNNKILSREEIEAISSFPLIGEVTQVKKDAAALIHEGDRSLLAEQFRLIRTSLPYLGINGRGKKIMVTSMVPGEGKSFIAANLAVSLAIGGKKVVLVEFDLSNPTLGLKLNIGSDKGLTDYLTGDAAPEEIIKHTSQNENLFLLPAGNLPVNPSELILSARTTKLLQYLDDIFDYIIVDSAPIALLSDAYILGRHCDATLYVIRYKYTLRSMLDRFEKNNKVNQLQNIGLVLNGVIQQKGNSQSYVYKYQDISVNKPAAKIKKLFRKS